MKTTGNGQSQLRIVVVASDAITASALYALLAEKRDLIPVAHLEPPDAQTLVTYRPDAILWDFGWTADLADYLRNADYPLPEQGLFDGAPVLGLVSDATQAIAVWRTGIRSILLRSETPGSLVAALHATAAGLWTLSPQISAALPVAGSRDLLSDMEPLTEREQEVLALVAEGLTNRGIGSRLAISEHTVKFHVNSILSKLGAESRTDAVVRATRAGLILL